jgi:DNA-binding LacI/PurR family transcriptional regulator
MPKAGFKLSGRPTLADIASRAGVSISAASLILSNKRKHRLSDDVADRVRKVAAELDYVPNLLVHSLQRGRTDTLVFYNAFRTRGEQDLYMDKVSSAIELAGGRHGFDILVHCIFTRSVEDTYRHLNGGRCDGMLFWAPPQNDCLLPYLRNSRLPTVLINSVDGEGILSYVKEDQIDGLSQVSDALCRFGHRRVAILTTIPNANPDADARAWMLRQLLAVRGVPTPERWIIGTDENEQSIADVLRFLMSEPTPPTAIFCWHDQLGYKVLDVCNMLGIAVPDQLSLIGYDGMRWPIMSRHVLASVQVNLEDIADTSVALLKQLINGEVSAPTAMIRQVAFDHGTTLGKFVAK